MREASSSDIGSILSLGDAGLDGLKKLGLFVVRPAGNEGWTRARPDGRLHSDDRQAFRDLGKAKPGGAAMALEYRTKVGGEWRWIRTRVAAVESDSGSFIVGVDEDVTERRTAEARLGAELEEAERRFDLSESIRTAELVASASPDIGSTVAAVLGQAKLSIPFSYARVYANSGEELRIMGGFPEEEAECREAEGSVPERVRKVVESRSPLVIHEECSLWIGVPLIFRGAILGAFEFRIPDEEGRGGDYALPAMIFGDMLAIKMDGEARHRELVRAASMDGLTGLLARRSFTDLASRLLERLASEGDSVALILADIDRFKSFNDLYGHLVGDEVLRHVARSMKDGLRQGDVICRFGGEEIVALLPSANAEVALEVAERLRAKVEAGALEGVEARVTASFGVAACAASACGGLEELVERADRAMYRAKDLGRNRVVLDGGEAPTR